MIDKVYNYQQLENGRWGILVDGKLIATIGCLNTCQNIVYFLKTRRANPGIPTIIENNSVNKYFSDLKLRP